MADAMLFEVDASKIVAKLHLAGRQPLKIEYGKGEFLANTGVVDDDIKATPENPGKVSFDIAKKSYQVGYVVAVQYFKKYGIEDALKKLRDAFEKAIGDDSKIDTSITSDEQKAYDAAQEEFKKYFINDKEQLEAFKNNDTFLTKEGISSLDDVVKAAQEKDEESYNAALETAKKKAYDQISKYLNVFAGKDNVNAFSADSLGQVFVAESVKDGNDKQLVNNGVFQQASDAEKQKMVAAFRAEFEKDPNKDNCKHRICFFANYTLDVDK